MPAKNAADELSTDALLRALVALAVDQREATLDGDRRKTEVLLADAGLTPRQIAALVDKNEGAVAKAISRARKTRGTAHGDGGAA